MTPTTTAGPVHYGPYDVEIDCDPYPTWRRLRDESPLYRNEALDFYAPVSYTHLTLPTIYSV